MENTDKVVYQSPYDIMRYHTSKLQPQNLPELTQCPTKVQITQQIGTIVWTKFLSMIPNPVS